MWNDKPHERLLWGSALPICVITLCDVLIILLLEKQKVPTTHTVVGVHLVFCEELILKLAVVPTGKCLGSNTIAGKKNPADVWVRWIWWLKKQGNPQKSGISRIPAICYRDKRRRSDMSVMSFFFDVFLAKASRIWTWNFSFSWSAWD